MVKITRLQLINYNIVISFLFFSFLFFGRDRGTRENLRRIDRWSALATVLSRGNQLFLRDSGSVFIGSFEKFQGGGAHQRFVRTPLSGFIPALKSALSAGKNRCSPSPVCFRPCFYSSPSSRRRVAVFPPVNKSRSHPPPFFFFSFFLSTKFFFFL